MTTTQFATLVRYYTGTNSSTFTDAEILALANPYKDDIAAEIATANEDVFGAIYYRDLIAGRREYALPDEIMNSLKYVDAKLDGTNWTHLLEFDINSYKRPTDEANTLLAFSELRPMFDLYRRALQVYSGSAIIDVTDGLKVYAIIFPADITSLAGSTDMSADPSTTTHGIPKPFHELLARRVSIGYKASQNKPRKLSPLEQMYEIDLKKAVDKLRAGNLDRSIIATVPHNDGTQY